MSASVPGARLQLAACSHQVRNDQGKGGGGAPHRYQAKKKQRTGLCVFSQLKCLFNALLAAAHFLKKKITCMSANLRDFSRFLMSGDAGG